MPSIPESVAAGRLLPENLRDISPEINRQRFYERQTRLHYFALADCNNFFVSCERLFRPDLSNRPVLVLSNNDGCVISRSNEVKALGIKMGVPLFQIKHLVRQYNIAVFSSNFPLYLDLSARVASVLNDSAPALERYSIDEAFMDLTGMQKNYNIFDYCMDIRWRVTHDVGIPICVGAGSTKTLAKIANHCAKKGMTLGGVMTIDNDDERIYALKQTPLDDIWGIGRALEQKFRERYGVRTAYDLSLLDPEIIKKQFNITAANVIYELNGISCIPFEDMPRPKKQIMWSRTFGHHILSLEELSQAVSEFTARAAEKLREDQQFTAIVSVFIQTNRASTVDPQYARQAYIRLPCPLNDTPGLIQAANSVLEKIFVSGYRYYKAGVIFEDLRATSTYQCGLFDDNTLTEEARQKRQRIQAAVDKLNQKKRNTVFMASQGIYARQNVSAQHNVSPGYTTSWKDVPKVK